MTRGVHYCPLFISSLDIDKIKHWMHTGFYSWLKKKHLKGKMHVFYNELSCQFLFFPRPIKTRECPFFWKKELKTVPKEQRSVLGTAAAVSQVVLQKVTLTALPPLQHEGPAFERKPLWRFCGRQSSLQGNSTDLRAPTARILFSRTCNQKAKQNKTFSSQLSGKTQCSHCGAPSLLSQPSLCESAPGFLDCGLN